MEKQHEAASDSISTVGVNVKDYPPSEVYSSEPPPAYVRPRANAVQIARIAACTLVAVSFILGFFMLASAYVTATVSCSYGPDYPQPPQEGEDRPTFQHLVDPLDSEETQGSQGKRETPPEVGDNRIDDDQEKPVQIKLPLQLDFDDIAGALMDKNQRSRMNCVVEKRRAEEVMDHQPKTVRLPFGLNLTTDPRYEHITGERMAIFCESGNDQRNVPMEQQVTPIMVPIPIHHAVPVPQPMMPHQMLPPQQGPLPQMFPHQPPQVPPRPPFQPPIHPAQLQHLAQLHQARMLMAQQQQPHNGPVHQTMPHRIPQHHQQQQQQHMMPQGRMMAEPSVHLHLQQMQPPHPQPHASEEQPIQIIREEHIIPIFQVESEETPVPADTVRPPPPPHAFHRLPIHIREHIRVNEQEQPIQMEEQRPHYVQPRSIRSVESVFHPREKRVRRCACDCSC